MVNHQRPAFASRWIFFSSFSKLIMAALFVLAHFEDFWGWVLLSVSTLLIIGLIHQSVKHGPCNFQWINVFRNIALIAVLWGNLCGFFAQGKHSFTLVCKKCVFLSAPFLSRSYLLFYTDGYVCSRIGRHSGELSVLCFYESKAFYVFSSSSSSTKASNLAHVLQIRDSGTDCVDSKSDSEWWKQLVNNRTSNPSYPS